MLSQWLYNIITVNRKRVGKQMDLEFVLDKMGKGGSYTLLPKHSDAVSIETDCTFYIPPKLGDTLLNKDSRLFLFSAPGATGKSALAKFISRRKNALLWDLSKDPIASHSFSGMLVESLGPKGFSQFTEGLSNGNAVLVIDALDEAEMISGRSAIETLLMDLRNVVSEATCPNIALCARTETAHFIRNFYSQEENKLEISQYEISFFAETEAIEFVKLKIEENRNKVGDYRVVTPATVNCIKELFSEIKRLLQWDESALRSFIGYAPVLEALAIYCDEENNTMQLVQRIKNSSCSAEIFIKIMDHILLREQGKVINGFRERCIANYPEFQNWGCVYSAQEQLVRIINYILLGEIYFEAYQNDELPQELLSEYKECVMTFLKDHPFVHMFDHADVASVDFTGPAFRDYVLARLMTEFRADDDCDEYAQSYFGEHCNHARFPSQLYFDLYENYSNGNIKAQHFQYLYEAFKAKEREKFTSSVSVEQVDKEVVFVFNQDSAAKVNAVREVEFTAADVNQPLRIIQFNNGYIDVDFDVILGSDKQDVIISNSTIKCRKIIIEAENVMLTADSGSEMLIVSKEGIDVSRRPQAKFDVRVEDTDVLRISTPDIKNRYKLMKYAYTLDDETELDPTKFEHAARAILKYFRKDRKDAPGKHREYIDFVIVGKSPLKKSILDFFIDKGIIYRDSKDPKQYKLSNLALEKLGVNWGMLSANYVGSMGDVYGVYVDWKNNKE